MRLADIEKLDLVSYEGIPEGYKDTFDSGVLYAMNLIDGLDTIEAIPKGRGGTYECFHCGSQSVVWDCDYDFSDYGYSGEGIVQSCHCENCGAEIMYLISDDPDEE